MINKAYKSLLVVSMVALFTAQSYQSDDKNQKAQAHNNLPNRQVILNRNEPSVESTRPQKPVSSHPQQPVERHPQQPTPVQNVDYNNQRNQIVQFHKQEPAGSQSRLDHRSWSEAPVFGVMVNQSVENQPTSNNNLFHRHHSDDWHPRYNYYDNDYHFYPYVNISTLVELTSASQMIVYNGQNYCYDQGTFYILNATGQYQAVTPPIGIVVNSIPANAWQFTFNGQIYYRSKGVFYVQVPQGYEVIAPLESSSEDQ